MSEDKPTIETDSGIEIEPLYRAPDARDSLADPGMFPYVRGIYPTMYRGRTWTMRQYSGFSTAEESNARYRLLLERGTTGLSVAFDLPTQLGLDADDERAWGEVGRVGVPISTVDDMRRLFDGIDQSVVTTSMTINAPAALLFLMYDIVAEERGIPGNLLGGTIQNDILKEYAARGTYIFPPRPSMRLVTDTFAYCREHHPAWNTISVSGYHIREAGSSAAQEIAFTVANGLAYLDAAVAKGMSVDDVAPRMSFFFAAHSNLFEEAAKFRAARKLWAASVRERFQPRDARSEMMRFHTQTGGVTLTAQQPLTNVVRVAYQALAAVLGTQSLHTNSYDEALGLPTEDAATLALRTQQVLAAETGVAATADPLAGSYYVERLTAELEQHACEWLAQVDARGGAVAAIESGFVQNAIADNAYLLETQRESGQRAIVGVNRFVSGEEVRIPVQRIDERSVARQVERVRQHKADQHEAVVTDALEQVRLAALSEETNLLVPMRRALQSGATLGQICDQLRAVFGEHRAYS